MDARVRTVTFGDLAAGAKFYDKWTKTRFVKQDDNGAYELLRETGEVDRIPCGFKQDEKVVPIY